MSWHKNSVAKDRRIGVGQNEDERDLILIRRLAVLPVYAMIDVCAVSRLQKDCKI